MKSILDPEFRYTPAHATNIRKTFAKAKRKLAEQKASEEAAEQERQSKVTLFKPKTATGHDSN